MRKRFMNLYNERIRREMTQPVIAAEIGISKSSYWEKETGRREFTSTEMLKLARLFDKSLDYLFEEDKVNV